MAKRQSSFEVRAIIQETQLAHQGKYKVHLADLEHTYGKNNVVEARKSPHFVASAVVES